MSKYHQTIDDLTVKLKILTKADLAAILASELVARHPNEDPGTLFRRAMSAPHANWLAAGSPQEEPDQMIISGE